MPLKQVRRLLLILLLAAAADTALSAQTSQENTYPQAEQNSSSWDCSDPLIATTAACAGQIPQANTQFQIPSTQTPAAGQTGISPLSTGTYSDLQQWARQTEAQSQFYQMLVPPEPLTEFQKFVASTTGQILPIYGANLFRRLPSTFAPLSVAQVPADYVIGPDDVLRIRIWGQINYQANVRVDRSGDIYIPQVGAVHVAGLAFSALDPHLRAAVGRVYRNFDLSADMGQIRAIQVYVAGEARRPGMYTVSALSTLVDAIFASGGPSVHGSLRNIELRRGGAVVTDFDLYGLLIHGDKSKDAKLLPGDVIFIPPAGPQAAVTGSVRNPGIYELRAGESLSSLLSDAGGASPTASEARISIERIDGHQSRQAMEVAYDAAGLATPVADGDLIRVYSIIPRYTRTVILRGNLANPGRFAWHPGMRISDLIPDKDSLITRNYWWHRAQLGLPAPEFEPIEGLATMRQPTEDHSIQIPRTNAYGQYGLPETPSEYQQGQCPYGMYGAYGTYGAQSNAQRNPYCVPQQGQQNPYGNQQGQQNQYNPQQGQQSQYGTQQQGQYGYQPGYGSEYGPGYGQNQSLSAQQRPGHAALATEETNPLNQQFPGLPRNRVQLLAPDIDWDYAVIERLDPHTLKTTLIPFDLGKLVLDHDDSQNLPLEPGDVVTIFSSADIQTPIAHQTKLVYLEGEFVHAGVYSVRPGETLRDLVRRAGGLTPNAYLYGSEFTRESTRAIQQARIDEYVQSLNLRIMRNTLALAAAPGTAAQSLTSGSAAQVSEQELVAAMRQIRATGRIVLAFQPGSRGIDSVPNIPLENGDRFIVPHVPAVVNLVGAVYDQNSFLYAQGRRVGTYMRLAGGPDKDADRKHEFVIRADGEVVSYETAHGVWGNEFNELPIFPGDTIVIPEKTFKPSALVGVLDWSSLFSQFALGASALSVIH